jgi:MFS family permease
MFVVGLSIFTATSVVCGAAPDITVLNSARALQGIGAAIMFAVSLSLLAQAFPRPRSARAHWRSTARRSAPRSPSARSPAAR